MTALQFAQALTASKLGTAAKKAKADARAANLAPVIAAIRTEGATSVAAIAAALTVRGVPTPGGRSRWYPAQVRRVLARGGG